MWSVLPSLAYLLALFWVIASRASYPYELEWMEGGTWQHVQRVIAGQPLYIEPSLTFTPFLYPPGYYDLAAFVQRVTGMHGFLPLRLLSILSTLVCLILIARWVWNETQSPAGAVAAAGFYAACFACCGFFYDLARVDTLAMALLIAGAFTLRFANQTRHLLLAIGLLAFSVMTKQTVIPMLPLLPLLLRRKGWERGLFALALFSTTVLLFQTVKLWQGEYLALYFWVLPQSHTWLWSQGLKMGVHDLGYPFWPTWLLLVVVSYYHRGFRLTLSPLLPWLLSALTVAWLGRMHSGGFLNVLMPAHLVLSLCFGILVGSITKQYSPRWRSLLFYGLVLTQWLILAYQPLRAIPTTADRLAGDRLVAWIRNQATPPFILNHPYLLERANFPGHAHRMALEDVLRAGKQDQRLRRDLDSLGHIPDLSLLLDSPDWREEAIFAQWPTPPLQKEPFSWGLRVFRPVAGEGFRPQFRFSHSL